MLFSLLVVIVTNVLALVTGAQPLFIRLLVGLGSLWRRNLRAIAVFRLAKELIGTGIAILCIVLTIIPCIGLITLLVLNQKATSYLQQHGIKVGFMGVDPKRI